MRPEWLRISAFGPFATPTEIDFRDFGPDPLFLINGRTGSGKSTILDAICFALYGVTTGDERRGTEMRCQYAAASVPTQLELIFRLGDRRYLVTRSPQYDRPKARGEGTTVQKATASLYRLADSDDPDDGALLAAQPRDVNARIVELTGMQSEQFRRVVVLPQGQFRELLTANSRDREELFGRLFATELYRRIEAILKEDAATLRRELAATQNKIDGILDSEETCSSVDELRALAASQRDAAEALGKRLSTLESTLQTAEQGLLAAQQGNEKLARREARQAELLRREEEAREQLPAWRRALEQARQAAPVAAAGQREGETAEALASLVALSALREQAVVDCQQRVEEASAVDARLRSEEARARLAEARQRRAALESMQEQLRALDGAIAEATEANAAVVDASTGQRQSEQALQTAESAAAALDARLQDLRRERAQHDAVAAELSPWRERLRLAERLEALRVERRTVAQSEVAAREDLERARQALDCAQRQHRTLLMHWHADQAAMLAAGLAEDAPCPVCGSREHPAPATPAAEAVSAADVENADTQLAQCGREELRASNDLQRLQERALELDREIEALHGGDAPLPALDDARSRVGACEEAARAVQRTQTAIDDAEEERARGERGRAVLRSALAQSVAALQGAQQRASRARGIVETLEAQLPEALRHSDALSAELDAVRAQIQEDEAQREAATGALREAAEALAAAQSQRQSHAEQLVAAREAQEQATATLVRLLDASPFGDLAAALAARLAPDEESRIAEALQATESTLAELRGEVRSLNEDCASLSPVDLEPLAERVRALLAERDALRSESQQTLSRADHLQAQLRSIEGLLQSQAQTYARAEVVTTLADVANGQRGQQQKLSFHRYVLGVLLDEVLLQASQRLRTMSSGRYELRRREGGTHLAAPAGLDLDVYDEYSGDVRPATSLSGGESFMAALALALGLSDVAQAQSGGVRIDTLFVDEGFGTLDEDALQQALDVLLKLRSSGRMVGVISHVEELKSRMPLRIDVRESRVGSKAVLVGCAGG